MSEYHFRENSLGEGFFADKVVAEKNVALGREYFRFVWEARRIVETGKLSPVALEALHRYNRITAWIREEYGGLPCPSKEYTDLFMKAKIFELMMFEDDCWKFWEWLRDITLREVSQRRR